jgi:hypothetical protein
VLDKCRIALTSNQSVTHDDVRLQALHHNGIKRGIIVIDLRHEAANMLRLLAHVFMLEEGALQRHRPTFADQPNVR